MANKRSFQIFGLRHLIAAGVAFYSFNVIPSVIKYCGQVYAKMWLAILELFGYNRAALFLFCTMASLGITFWLIVFLFMSLDLYGKPEFLKVYKVQPNKNVPVDKRLYRKCVNVVNVNQLIAAIMVIAMYPLTKWRGMAFKAEDLPSFQRGFLEMLFFIMTQEVTFYYLHRLMHHPTFYKRVHKVHHEWTAPISLAVVYVHPIEHIFVNMLPILFSPILIGSHLSTSCLWYVLATFVSTIHHSGYHFPGFPSPEFHDYHHVKFNQCYGTIGLLDRLHKTDLQYRKSSNYKWDRAYLSLKPIWIK